MARERLDRQARDLSQLHRHLEAFSPLTLDAGQVAFRNANVGRELGEGDALLGAILLQGGVNHAPLYPMQECMTSKIAYHTVPSETDVADNRLMPRKARPHPKPARRPTYIRAWRKMRGLTLAQLADQLATLHDVEISEGQLSRIENGKSPYAQDLLEAIADVLRTEPASLIMRDPSRQEFWSIYDTLSPVQRQQVVEYADFIKRKAG